MAVTPSYPSKVRLQNLTKLRDWCMDRISFLSLRGSDLDAQAITNEHLEILRSVDSESTLWLKVEKRN